MSMFGDFQVSPPKVRVIELENGNKLNLTNTDPYGFIRLSLEHGQLPAHLKDASFTEWRLAEIAAAKYVSERQEALATVTHKEDKPLAKRA